VVANVLPDTRQHKTFAVGAAAAPSLFDSGIRGSGPNRGLMYWASGSDRRVFAAVDNFIYALNAATGKPIDGFGTAGRIDLRENLGRDPQLQNVRLTSPGVIYQDLMIVGGRLGESLPTAPGDVRAYDVRTGRALFVSHDPHPGSLADTWPKDAWQSQRRGRGRDALDSELVIPDRSAASDFDGADRQGDNLCELADRAQAATGKRVALQFVRHDAGTGISPRAALVTRGATARTSTPSRRQRNTFVFVAISHGEPLFPIEYRNIRAQSQVRSPATRSRCQQSRAVFATSLLTAALDESNACGSSVGGRSDRRPRSDGQFVPLAVDQQTVVFPGFDGGAEWGGQAFDPQTGLYYVNANDLVWTGGLAPNTGGQSGRAMYLQHCAGCHRDDRLGTPPQIASLVGIADRLSFSDVVAVIRQGRGRMTAFPQLEGTTVNAIAQFVLTGEDVPAGRGSRGDGGGGRGGPVDPRINNDFRFTGYQFRS
jgi:quinoprotein glucose dehydrogenase